MSDVQVRAGRREWVGLAVLVLPCLLISMDVSVLFFGLPFISADLEPTATQQLWIMDSYGFALGGLLITMGALGDRIGRRRLLLIGAAAFGVASVIAAYSASAEILILTRGILGVAGATLMPSTLALIRNMFHDGRQRKTAIAIWTTGMTSGAILGPIAGGLLLEHFWWGSAFLINVPAMLLLLVLGPILLPEFRTPQAGRFDLVGAGLSLAAVLAVIYGIKQTAVHGFDLASILVLVAGLGLGAVFVHRQRTGRNPLLDLALFANRTFTASVVINLFAMFAFLGITLFTNQYLQLVLGLSPFTAALWSLAVMPAIMVAMTVAGILADKVRPVFLVVTGLLTLAAALVVLSRLTVDSPLWLVLLGSGAVAAGVLVATTLTADLILSAAPPERAGAASALSETSSELGGALGMAILGSIGAAVYHSRMADTLPAGLPTDAAVAAKETLGGADAVAATLGDTGPSVLLAARTAFTDGFTLTATFGAILVAALAALSYRLLRTVPFQHTPPTPAQPTNPTMATHP